MTQPSMVRPIRVTARGNGYGIVRSFNTLDDARRFAWRRVGKRPEFFTNPAGELVARNDHEHVTVVGATIEELFP